MFPVVMWNENQIITVIPKARRIGFWYHRQWARHTVILATLNVHLCRSGLYGARVRNSLKRLKIRAPWTVSLQMIFGWQGSRLSIGCSPRRVYVKVCVCVFSCVRVCACVDGCWRLCVYTTTVIPVRPGNENFQKRLSEGLSLSLSL